MENWGGHVRPMATSLRGQLQGGFFHSKSTWGCAAHKGILFGTSSLAKGIFFGKFSSSLVYARVCFLAILVNAL